MIHVLLITKFILLSVRCVTQSQNHHLLPSHFPQPPHLLLLEFRRSIIIQCDFWCVFFDLVPIISPTIIHVSGSSILCSLVPLCEQLSYLPVGICLAIFVVDYYEQ